jgi:hypothetical protein
MKKLLGWISVIAPALAIATASFGIPKLLGIFLLLIFVTDPAIQVIIGLILLFIGSALLL